MHEINRRRMPKCVWLFFFRFMHMRQVSSDEHVCLYNEIEHFLRLLLRIKNEVARFIYYDHKLLNKHVI